MPDQPQEDPVSTPTRSLLEIEHLAISFSQPRPAVNDIHAEVGVTKLYN